VSARDDFPDLAYYATDKGRGILKTDEAARALDKIDQLQAELLAHAKDATPK